MKNDYNETLELSSEILQTIFGLCDQYIQIMEKDLNVDIVLRNEFLYIYGEPEQVRKAKHLLCELAEIAGRDHGMELQKVSYGTTLAKENESDVLLELDESVICHTTMGKAVKPKTKGQKEYVDAIARDMIVFGTGPAGTGKTYLAMAMAISAFKKEEVSRIILTRPAIEAGEKLGFLPGDLQSKVDPYLRPLYDALYQIMGADSFTKNMEKGLIEVAPLAYMRGRTLDNSFIILDEAQNTTPAQMKMFLTRIGFGSKVVITGDKSQKDLPAGTMSGLDQALGILKNLEGISICELTSKDIVRHPLVMKIVEAYDRFEANGQKRENGKKAGNRRKGR